MGRKSLVTYPEVKATTDDMAFLCLLSLGHAIQRGKTYILSIEERRGRGQAYPKGVFHIRTRTQMDKNIVSCELYLLPLEVSAGSFGDMGSAAGGRPDTLSHCKRYLLGRNGISTGGGGCLYGGPADSKAWWQVYWRIERKSGVFPISYGE